MNSGVASFRPQTVSRTQYARALSCCKIKNSPDSVFWGQAAWNKEGDDDDDQRIAHEICILKACMYVKRGYFEQIMWHCQ